MYAHSCTQMYLCVTVECGWWGTAGMTCSSLLIDTHLSDRASVMGFYIYERMYAHTFICTQTETFCVINSKAGRGETAFCFPVSRRAADTPNIILFHFQVCF